MKYVFFLGFLWLVSCTQHTDSSQLVETSSEISSKDTTEVRQIAFQRLLDSSKLDGAILIFDPQERAYHSNDFAWAKTGFLPASTYKIPNSMIALETGVVEDENTLFPWDGKARMFKSWEADLTFRQAFLRSCVPCYQEIARQVGTLRMRHYVDTFQYGNLIFNDSTIDQFWLSGPSTITQFEQIDFLQRFYLHKLPISPRTDSLVKRIMILDESEQYTLRGKTGWSIDGDYNNGWFVGYITQDDHVYYFATNVIPQPGFDMKRFPSIRKQLTLAAFEKLGILAG